MKIRITGASKEVQELLEYLTIVSDIKNISKENAIKESSNVRVYADIKRPNLTPPALEAFKKLSMVKDETHAIAMYFDTSQSIFEFGVSDSIESSISMLRHLKVYGAQKIIDTMQQQLTDYGKNFLDKLVKGMSNVGLKK